MLKLHLLTGLSVLALTGLAAPAHADVYGGLRIGSAENVEASGVTLDGGLAYGAVVGLDGAGPLRLELGATHLEADAFGGAIDATAIDLSATAYLDLPLGEKTKLFVGAGVDYVLAEANAGFSTIDGTGTGWHGVVGVSHGPLEVFWRHTEASVDLGGGDVDLSADAVMLGYRFDLFS